MAFFFPPCRHLSLFSVLLSPHLLCLSLLFTSVLIDFLSLFHLCLFLLVPFFSFLFFLLPLCSLIFSFCISPLPSFHPYFRLPSSFLHGANHHSHCRDLDGVFQGLYTMDVFFPVPISHTKNFFFQTADWACESECEYLSVNEQLFYFQNWGQIFCEQTYCPIMMVVQNGRHASHSINTDGWHVLYLCQHQELFDKMQMITKTTLLKTIYGKVLPI